MEESENVYKVHAYKSLHNLVQRIPIHINENDLSVSIDEAVIIYGYKLTLHNVYITFRSKDPIPLSCCKVLVMVIFYRDAKGMGLYLRVILSL